jgi:5-(carboxyamino)imidazole ribonucleotide synthase
VAPRLGIVGAGQLARMTHQAAIALGLSVRLLAGDEADAAALVAADVEVGSPRDAEVLEGFAAGCDVVTLEHELVDADGLARLAPGVARPSAEVLRVAQDKGRQRLLCAELGLPAPAWALVEDAAAVEAFAAEHGWPVVLKAARGGYDGRGVAVAGDEREAAAVHAELASGGREVLAEERVDLAAEVAVLVARTPAGAVTTWPVTGTVQVEGICRELLVPSGLPAAVEDEARSLAVRFAEAIGATGILALELFVDQAGRLLVNEVAARPHNSGHWTIEGAITSQFENHVRAVLGWGLGATDLAAPAVATANVLGPRDGTDPADRLPDLLAADPAIKVHLYGKAARPGRKVGHVTALDADVASARARARAAAELLMGEPLP